LLFTGVDYLSWTAVDTISMKPAETWQRRR